MTNINRLRKGDKVTLDNGEIFEVKECWTANGIYQFKVDSKNKDEELILSYNISGKSLDPSLGSGHDIKSFEEVESPEDNITYYIPHFDVDMLPVLHVNGEDVIIYTLMDLNNMYIHEAQKLEASYKFVIIATLQKKKGRDFCVLKTQKVICESREDCEAKLLMMSGNVKGANVDKKLVEEEFTKALKSVDNK